MSEKLRTLLFALSVTLILMVGVVGTYSYFTDTTDAKVNTFTVGKVGITLDEADVDESSLGDRDRKNTYKMIPGEELSKDPLVTVKGGSHASWVFVEVIDNEVSYNGEKYQASDFLTYSINEGADAWIKLGSVDNVYYRLVPATNADLILPNILVDNKVVVKNNITMDMLNNIAKEKVYPQLSFKAYAFQVEKGDPDGDGELETYTVDEAWALLHAE